MPTGNQEPQPQDPTSQRERYIMRRTRVQGREARFGIGDVEAGTKKGKRPPNSN